MGRRKEKKKKGERVFAAEKGKKKKTGKSGKQPPCIFKEGTRGKSERPKREKEGGALLFISSKAKTKKRTESWGGGGKSM